MIGQGQIVQITRLDPMVSLWLLVGMIGLSFFIEGAFRVLTGREFRPAGIRPENR